MELLEYWQLLRRRFWIIALVLLVGSAGAWWYAQRRPTVYLATATLVINPVADNPLFPYQRMESDELVRLYAEFLRSEAFAAKVARFDPTLAADAVQAALTTDFTDDQFFVINATDTDPARAQAIANGAAMVFVSENAARLQAQQRQFDPSSPDQALAYQDPAVQTVVQQELDYITTQIAQVEQAIANVQGQARSTSLNQQVQSSIEELFRLRSLRAEMLSSMPTSVVQPAALPSSPEPAGRLALLAQASAAALVVGVGLALLIEYLDNTIRSPMALSVVYGQAAWGVTQRLAARTVRRAGQLVVAADTHPATTEAFRALRLTLRAHPAALARGVLVTSALPQEGKTYVAVNLATSLAHNGCRVVLVDANLRQPMLHTLLDCAQQPGFTDLVADSACALAAYLQPTPVTNLWLLAGGTWLAAAPDLLGSPQTITLMEHLNSWADVVIYDTPALATGIDALALAADVGSVLQVIRAGNTRIDNVLHCKASLAPHARLLGPVLNQVRRSGRERRAGLPAAHAPHRSPTADRVVVGPESVVEPESVYP